MNKKRTIELYNSFIKNKVLLTARWTFVLVLVNIFTLSAKTYSQETFLTLHLKNVTVKDVLHEISGQTEFTFAWSNHFVNLNKKVSINVNHQTVDAVLNQLFQGTDVQYQIYGKKIILFSSPHTPKTPQSQTNIVTVSGTVTNTSGETLPGVSVYIKGTENGTVTDVNGKYSIKVPKGSVLVFSYVGMQSQEVQITTQRLLNIVLKPTTKTLKDVVVVGYGVQKKTKVTGSITSLNGKTLAKKDFPNMTQSLQGEAPGLTIINHGGAPGHEDLRMFIRGISSLSAGTYPLVLVDGIRMPISDVNPNDVKSVSVLKDAASCAIYGAQAANGVILITTKRGVAGGFTVNYNGYYGVQTPASLPELIDAKDYLNLVNEALVNAGQPPKYSQDYIEKTVSGVDPIKYPYTNILEALYHPANIWNNYVSVQGGSDKVKIALSANRLDQTGMLENVSSNRTGFRLNTDIQLYKRFKITTETWYNMRNTQRPHRFQSALSDMIGTSPVTVLKYPNGTYGLNKDNTNALADLEVSGTDWNKDKLLNLQLGFDWNLFKGFHFKGNASYKNSYNWFKNFAAEYEFKDPYDTSKIVTKWTPSSVTEGQWTTNETNIRLLLDYTRQIKAHSFHFLGGMEITDSKSRYLEGYRKNIYSNDYPVLNMGDVKGQTNKGYHESWGLWSYLGRFNYSYKNRYLFEANFRYDGSSRFAEGNRWGFFPSFSAGWIMSKENWLKEIAWLSNLKLRASWGQLGNQNIGLYRYTSTIYSTYPYNFNDVQVNGYSQAYYANTDISWETTQITDIGIDVGFLNNRITLSGDWYDKETKDVLLTLPISYMVGLYPSETNAGRISNKGWELAIHYKDTKKNFHYQFGFNVAELQNKLADFAGHSPVISGWTILEEGAPLYSLYGYKSDGLFQSQEDIDTSAIQPNESQLKPGDIKLVDLNGDDTINDKDRTIIGNTIPKYTFGFNFSLEYKGFDLSGFLQGVWKVQNYFYGALNEGVNFEIFSTPRVLDRWTPTNRDASFPRLQAASNKNNYLYSDFWVRDASYLRLKNIQIGYTLPYNLTKKAHFTKVRVYAGATNLFTITKVDPGVDPETYSGRFSAYPPTRIYMFGLQLGF